MESKFKRVRIKLITDYTYLCKEEIDGPLKAMELIAEKVLFGSDKEKFIVVNLDGRLKPINFEVISIGSTKYSCFSTSDVFKSAILSNASNIMVMHLHPSGNTEPSGCDIQRTNGLRKAAEIMKINLVDHIIVGESKSDGYYSFKEHNLL